MEGTVLGDLFDNLDQKLTELATSDSAIEYAPQIRDSFDRTIRALNEIKLYLGGNSTTIDKYFENP